MTISPASPPLLCVGAAGCDVSVTEGSKGGCEVSVGGGGGSLVDVGRETVGRDTVGKESVGVLAGKVAVAGMLTDVAVRDGEAVTAVCVGPSAGALRVLIGVRNTGAKGV